MAAQYSSAPLVVIVGPTASGKTALAVDLAKRFGGEIICADSRTIYKGMDVGTAKPTAEEQRAVRHWGLDLVEPGGKFTAFDFKQYALQKIEDIRRRGKVPFLVGGSGLYVDAIVFDYQFGDTVDNEERRRLEHMSLEELYGYSIKNNVELPENTKNKRYVIRAIEQKGINTKRRLIPIDDCIVVGISTDKSVLRRRIELRSEQIFDNGVVEEAIKLGKKYGWKSEAMTGNIYPIVHKYILGNITVSQMRELFVTADWRLAKRQLTWLRRNPYIVWGDIETLKKRISKVLAPE